MLWFFNDWHAVVAFVGDAHGAALAVHLGSLVERRIGLISLSYLNVRLVVSISVIFHSLLFIPLII